MTCEGTAPSNRFVFGCYVGFVLAAGAVIIPLTLTAGIHLHTLVAGQLDSAPWHSVFVTPGSLVVTSFSIGVVCLVLYAVCRIIGTVGDSLFAQAVHAPDGRKLTGLLGLLATFLLAAFWVLPLWSPLLPEVAATAAEAAPATLPGNLRTLPAVVPVIGALYGYFVLTGCGYALPEGTRSDSPTETPGYAKVTTPSMPRTTETTVSPSIRGRNRWGESTPPVRSDLNLCDPDDISATATDGSVQEEMGDADGEKPTRDDTDSARDARAEFEKEILEQADADGRDAASDCGSPVDLDERQFDWTLTTEVGMDDVGGMDDVKEELRRDIVDPMKEEPERAEKFDIPLPNLLLYGPPGTGKTYLAKALATELAFPFVSLSGSDVTSRWVNESSERVGQLFDEAQDLAAEVDGAVIFLDELDAVLPERRTESHGEDRKVVNEFLSRLQESARERVLFVGATNKRDDLDNAATRNGRIDKELFVGEPDYETRVEMFKAQLDGRPHALDEKDIEKLAERTSGVVAADIEFLVNQAARNAAYGRDAERIEVKDIELQLD